MNPLQVEGTFHLVKISVLVQNQRLLLILWNAGKAFLRG